MATVFDVLSTVCFGGIVIAFFQLTDRASKTLIQLLAPGAAFAVGNQLGNIGYSAFALLLISAGLGYAGLVLRRNRR
jgi:fructose-specific phosphotransferase system IIC component